MSDSGPVITISAHQLQREASEAIVLAMAMRDRATPGAHQDIPAALIARDRLRALIGSVEQSNTLLQNVE